MHLFRSNRDELIRIFMNWIMGSHGLQKIRTLSLNLFNKIRIKEETRLAMSLSEYMPWMSTPVFSDRMTTLFAQSILKDQVLIDETALRILRKSLWESKDLPLGGVSIKTDVMTINTRPDEMAIENYLRAIELVRKSSDRWNTLCDLMVKCLIPLRIRKKDVRSGGVGFSTEFLKGAVFLSVPMQEKFKDLELSINLSHEIGHQALMVYQAADPLIVGSLARPVFSAVRKENRPAIHAFHAMTALAFMCDYLNAVIKSSINLRPEEALYFQGRYNDLLKDLGIAIEAFKDVELTMIGQKIYQDFTTLYNKLTNCRESKWKVAASQ